MQERTGTDDKAYATGFELLLPTNWSERFIFQGGGGTDCTIRPAVGGTTIGKLPLFMEGNAVVAADAVQPLLISPRFLWHGPQGTC
jgi:feruloyl esterase